MDDSQWSSDHCHLVWNILIQDTVVWCTIVLTSSGYHMKRIIILVLAAKTLFGSVTFAQTVTPKVTKRQAHQQQRIKQGVKSGELTKGETARLEAQQGKIAVDKAKAKSDGVVTPGERAKN